ncbi:NAD(P)/FAD-dependent oxidoreductase [Williamsia deligens]|uniref:NAD(P)/FAD-dependent oxidoreductase n=1 Tax=Williamsia deligens TaxID=321325 RepID=A0ABW3G8P1_9NOCA|nr:NAD(P)/FAD-dependent oxidoreductase [Williamsia deligens]MCP2193240.1 NADH dehydrogenase [Williamsia deligens]
MGAPQYDVVVVGSGFGGVAAARRLARSDKSVLMISSVAQYLFQPLLYQVATGVLDADTVSPAAADSVDTKIDVVEGTVTAIDPDAHSVTYTGADREQQAGYSSLIAATGASQSYFGHDEYAHRTFSLKTREDAVALREQLVRNFARPDDRSASSYVVVGAGATGVELAGEIAGLARRHQRADVSITLVEGVGEVLPVFGGRLSRYAKKTLEAAGVDVVLKSLVTDIDDGVVTVDIEKGAATRRIASDTVIWAAGVSASPFAAVLAEATGCDTDRAGRLLVNPDLTVGGYADIYAIGDMTSLKGYPGQSPVAMQEGRHAADTITRKIGPGTPFRYFDKGSMSIIGRGKAVLQGPVGPGISGLPAWGAWLAVHLYYLSGVGNRIDAIGRWFGAYGANRRPALTAAQRAQEREPERVAG